MTRKALLISGGMDSICLAYWHKPSVGITIDYGQRPAIAELQAAKEACRVIGIEHTSLSIDCSSLGSGDLAGSAAMPIAPATDWWPYRNQMLITFAGAMALQHDCNELLIGAVRSDQYHQDGTPQFFEAISKLMELQEGNIKVSAPASGLSTTELVEQSGIPREILCWAHSCHISNHACGTCRGCVKHYETWEQIGDVAY